MQARIQARTPQAPLLLLNASNNGNNSNHNLSSSSRPNALYGNSHKNCVNPSPVFGADGNYFNNYVRNNPNNSNLFTLSESNHINPFNYHFHH